MSDPRIWAQDWWNTMARAAIAYAEKPTDDDKRYARYFFEGVGGVMPCPSCKNHYKQEFKTTFNDDVLQSNKTLQKWVYDLRERVNKRLGIPSNVASYEDVPKLVNKFPTRYVDLDTGKILAKARYVNEGGVSAPNERRAREWLEANLGKCLDDRPIWEKVYDPLSEKEERISKLVIIAATILGVLLLVVVPMYVYFMEKIRADQLKRCETVEHVTDKDSSLV